MNITELEDGTHILRGDRATIAIVILRGHEGVGEAIRRAGHERNDDIGNLLAEGRAFQALGRDIEEHAQHLIKQADEEARERRNREVVEASLAHQRREEEQLAEDRADVKRQAERLRKLIENPHDLPQHPFHARYNYDDASVAHGYETYPDTPPFIARVVAAMARRKDHA